jgi:glycerate-2-kinase
LSGEARDEGNDIVGEALEIAGRAKGRWAYVAGGETTVTLHGNGQGGRNQEAAVAAALRLDGLEEISMAAFATDGSDGNTDAAGALVDGNTIARARRAGIVPHEILQRNDSHSLLAATGDLLQTGPTGTNVADVWWVLGETRAS